MLYELLTASLKKPQTQRINVRGNVDENKDGSRTRQSSVASILRSRTAIPLDGVIFLCSFNVMLWW
jgi:hypothetical protein